MVCELCVGVNENVQCVYSWIVAVLPVHAESFVGASLRGRVGLQHER